jgi:hypothetical protein
VTIPEIRQRLYELAEEHNLPELADLANQTRRHYHGRRAPTSSVLLTDELKGRIRAYCKEHPDETMHRVGLKFGVNQGRVSEALFGERH